jgi:hypothetical protein
VKVRKVDVVVGRDVNCIVKTVVVGENTGRKFSPVAHCPVAGGTVLIFEMRTSNTCHKFCLSSRDKYEFKSHLLA